MPPKALSQTVCRGEIEKHRRQHMKDLCSNLESLLPPLPSPSPSLQEKLPVMATLDRAVGYVKQLKEKVEEMKTRKEGLKEDLAMAGVEVNENESEVEVHLVTGLNKGFMLQKVLGILEEEGAQVLRANCSRLSDRIVYSITAQAFCPRIGIETSKVLERLRILSGVSGTFVLQ